MDKAEIYKQGGAEGFVAGFKFVVQLQYAMMEEVIKLTEDPETKEFLEKSLEGFLMISDYLDKGLEGFLEDWGKHCCGPGSHLVEKGVI